MGVACAGRRGRLERRAVGAEQSVAPLDEALLVAAQAADLDDVARDLVIVENLPRLGSGRDGGVGGESEGQGGGGGEGKGWPRRQCFRARRTCWRWTERASSLMRSRALMIEYGSHVLRVVLTVIEPSIRSSWVGGAG